MLRFYSAGDLLGGSIQYGADIHGTYARVLEDSLVGFINEADFADLLRRYPQDSLEIIRRLSQELEMLRRRLAAVSYKGVRERLSDLLVELGEKYGVKEENGLLIDLGLTQEELAEMIGSARQTVSHHLGKLAQRGLISLEGHKILIIDEKGLKDLR